MANERKSYLDGFFSLGEKATGGDPVRKAHFDYSLYWVIFLTFVGLAVNYFYIFFSKGVLGSLMWGIIILVFSWFNYWGLMAFRQTYQNMKKFYSKPKEVKNASATDNEFKEAFSKTN